MRPKDIPFSQELEQRLNLFAEAIHPLPGINNQNDRVAFLEQLAESIHRVQYVSKLREIEISEKRINPSSDLFDPIKGAEFHRRNGNIEEAFWLIFLSVHFGKPLKHGWIRVSDVYGSLGKGPNWTWDLISNETAAFRSWLAENQHAIRGTFGNHRKYQSLDAIKNSGTGNAIATYVKWVMNFGTHQELFDNALRKTDDRRKAFDLLYHSMERVISFGRMAKFDYLSMIGKLGLADIEPGSTYMEGATGPYAGGNLLLLGKRRSNSYNRRRLDELLIKLDEFLQVGMQAIEDSLCNWHKSPGKFIAFRG